MKILGIDASGDDCSVALYVAGEYYENKIRAPRRHGEFILPMVEEALEAMKVAGHELDGITFGRGPGSFTGIRLTAGIAQGLAVGWSKKIFPVSNLAALAYKQYEQTLTALPIFIAIDARKQEVYAGEYQFFSDKMSITRPERVVAPELLEDVNVVLHEPPQAVDILRFAVYQLQNKEKWLSNNQVELTYLRNKVTD